MIEVQEMKQREHGTYTEIPTEKEVLKITTSTKRCVVHFYHKEFRRCLIMDKHLKELAHRHFKTKFIKIEVDNAAFLVERLQVQVLPCVIAFIDGISVDRIVGFEELGNSDNFDTKLLERRLALHGVIDMPKSTTGTTVKRKAISGRRGDEDSDESDGEN